LAGTPQHVSDAADAGKDVPAVHILHRGPRYIVRFLQATPDPWAVVSFEYWKPEPTLEGEFSGEGFFRHRGLNAFGIMAASNDWFQDDEILQVIAAINRVAEGWRLIGYGGSMGGFATINFYHDLHLANAVTVIPQFSIDGARAPYEPRWREEAARISFNHDKIDRIPRVTRAWAIFDPWCVDARHIADIQRYHRLTEIRVPFGGHAVMGMLQQANVYTDMFTDMLAERFDAQAFRRRWRAARRGSAQFWLGISQALLARGNAAGALRAALQARGLPHPDPGWVDIAEADARAALDETAAAVALLAPWLEHPGFGEMARSRRAQWSPPVLPAPTPHRPLWRRVAGRIRRAVTSPAG